jgi:ABC-type Fe2+-enterobactin transport system substrate-binding protein
VSLSERLRKLESVAQRIKRPSGPLVVLVYPDTAAGHPNLNESNMTQSQAARLRDELAERGQAGPLFIVMNDAAYLDL